MKKVLIESGGYRFVACLDEQNPQTCEWFEALLPWEAEMIHVSWSGEACFVPLKELAHQVPYENAMRVPSKGEVLVYPGNLPSLQMGGELFLCWGQSTFACENGNLTGNRLMTIVEGNENLREYGNLVHLGGAQKARFSRIP